MSHASLTDSRSRIDANSDELADTSVLGQYIPLIYHYHMLQDTDRVDAFRRAIELIVRPGMHVVELGGGTGILSSFAALAGASVTCVERNPELVRCARRCLADNALTNRVEVIQTDACRYLPDSPVDVVVCEMLHVGLLREKQAQVLTAFKKNYLSVFGPKLPVFIPEASILMAQPVQQCFDFSGYIAPVPMFQVPSPDQPRTREIATLYAYANIAYDDFIPSSLTMSAEIHAACDGRVNAIRLVTQNVLGIDMLQKQAITWPNQCLVLPIETPFDVSEHDSVKMSFGYRPGDDIETLSRSIKLIPPVQCSPRATGRPFD